MVKAEGNYLEVTPPFHHPVLSQEFKKFQQDLLRIGFNFKRADLSTPVFSTHDGANLQKK